VELDFSTSVLLGGENDAGIEGPGINVQADRPVIKFTRIVDAMHGLLRIDGAGMSRVHLHSVSCFEITGTGLKLLRNHTKILDQ
jgi:hypothetical protein